MYTILITVLPVLVSSLITFILTKRKVNSESYKLISESKLINAQTVKSYNEANQLAFDNYKEVLKNLQGQLEHVTLENLDLRNKIDLLEEKISILKATIVNCSEEKITTFLTNKEEIQALKFHVENLERALRNEKERNEIIIDKFKEILHQNNIITDFNFL